ncbi:MAG: dihydrolipoamide acetyltransferase family protein [Campylobacterota bacterium]|nr:dihydrolipoamide acetyltransferase family protein [Campylobacterota bacterium]
MSEFKMPSLGADMESAVLMEWLVKEGDRVNKGQVIAEVETSKGIIEIEVFEDGIIEKILVETETECEVGTPLALIRSEGESTAEVEAEPMAKAAPISKPQSTKPLEPEPSPELEEVPQEAIENVRIQASPAARKRAKELGVDLAALASKTEGKIRIKQVEAAAETEEKVPAKTPYIDGMRQAIAAAMSLSNREIPHYYLSTPINMTLSLQWLEKYNSSRPIQERILPAALLIRAVVSALKEVPELNGFWKDNAHQVSKAVHPGIAIALRKGGVITPALLDAQEMNLDETMKALSDLISRARAGKLRSAEVTQQTITITNLGDLGVELVYGVIYPPQVALVGLGRITDTPWAEGDALTVRKVMQATLSGDHRATDGRIGALLLEKLNQILQKPEELL